MRATHFALHVLKNVTYTMRNMLCNTLFAKQRALDAENHKVQVETTTYSSYAKQNAMSEIRWETICTACCTLGTGLWTLYTTYRNIHTVFRTLEPAMVFRAPSKKLVISVEQAHRILEFRVKSCGLLCTGQETRRHSVAHCDHMHVYARLRTPPGSNSFSLASSAW